VGARIRPKGADKDWHRTGIVAVPDRILVLPVQLSAHAAAMGREPAEKMLRPADDSVGDTRLGARASRRSMPPGDGPVQVSRPQPIRRPDGSRNLDASRRERSGRATAAHRRAPRPGRMPRFHVVKDHPGSRGPAVVFQEPAEAFPALDLPGRERDDVGLVATGDGRRDVAQALVTPLPVEVGQILVEDVPQVVLAEDDEVVQALSK
jgi:hypothetical protein